MTRYLTDDDKYNDLIHDDDYRSYLVSRRNSPGDYRFGRTHGKRVRVRARTALRRANVYIKDMIEAIANVKLRRMERELELRGIHLGRGDKPDSTQTATDRVYVAKRGVGTRQF
jgi:hypothetical protein